MKKEILKEINAIAYRSIENIAVREPLLEIELHNSVVHSILKLREFVPEEYRQHNLERVLVSKAITFNTSLDKSVRQHFYINKVISKFFGNGPISAALSSLIIDKKDKRLSESMQSKTYEDDDILSIESIDNSNSLISESELLFFSSQPSHLKVLVSFIEQASIANFRLVLPYRLKELVNLKELNQSKIIFFEELFQVNSKNLIKNYQEEFQQIFQDNKDHIKELFIFNKKNFFNSQRPGIENIFSYLFPQSLLYSLASEDLIKNTNAMKVVGVRPRRLFDRAILQKAYKLGLETNLIIHSTLGSDHKELWTSGLFDNLHNVFGWGKKHLELMKADSFFTNSKFHPVGSPLFNSPPAKRKIEGQEVKIIYASTRNDKRVIFALDTYKKRNESNSVTIKIHPGEEPPSYINKKIFKIELGSFPIESILENYHIFITTYSGSHISAISYGLPVIFAPFNREFIQDLETLYGINKETMSYSFAENEKQFQSILENTINNSQYREDLLSQQTRYFNNLIAGFSSEESSMSIKKELYS